MTAKVERLVNLTVALLETRRPLTWSEIRGKVAGYGQDDAESARRMFERDKDDLRRLGVPIETVTLDAFESDWGYRVDRRRYELPALDLTGEEVAALAVALQVTGLDTARLGFTKLAAPAPDPADRVAPPAHVEVDISHLDDLAEAVVERRTLRFGYRTGSGDEATRTVDPYGVVQRRGNWYLVGHDHDRDGPRAFRLDRFVSRARTVGGPGTYEVPGDLDLAAMVAGPAGEGTDAEVSFAPEVAWQAARRGEPAGEADDGWHLIRFPGADPERLLPWVLGFGASARVESPGELRAEATRRLEALTGDGS